MIPRLLRLAPVALLGLWATAACTDQIPTFDDGSAIPVEAETIEIVIPYSEFGRDFQVFGGFGFQADLPQTYAALDYRGDFTARYLARMGEFPGAIFVFPPEGTQTVGDSAYVPLGGDLVVRMDTTRHVPDEPVELALGAMEAQRWDIQTATWHAAVDTLGDHLEWDEPGGGTVRSLGTATWDPQEADSIIFRVDSVTANQWRDAETSVGRSFRIESRTPGHLLQVGTILLRADLRSTLQPDTVVTIERSTVGTTFLYTPEPGVTDQEFRIGGAPARRAYFRMDMPVRFEEGSAVCEALASCPLELTRDRVVYAGLVLRTRPVEPPAFAPLDTMRLEVRAALSPERIPRSPLGSPVQPSPRLLPPEAFVEDGERTIEVPMTRYVRDLIAGDEDDDPVPSTLAFFASTEPSGFQFASLVAPGFEGEPFIRLILTITDGVQLP